KRHRQLVHKIVELHEVAGVEVKVDVPAQRLNARQDALELIHVRHTAQVLHKVEAHAAEALFMERLKVTLGEGVVGVGYATILATTLCDRVDNDGVVDAMAARVHEHGTLETENRLQFLEARQ